ncbi:MAG: hypothetical protein WBG42_16680 [Cryomorphaceae bacterium]
MNLGQRLFSNTPKFFRIIRNIGLALIAGGGAVLTAPVSVPALVSTAAGYAAVAGGVLTAVAQATVDGE